MSSITSNIDRKESKTLTNINYYLNKKINIYYCLIFYIYF